MMSLRNLFPALFPLLLAGTVQSVEPESAGMKPEEWIKNYEEALATQEWEKVAPLVHSRCTVTFSNGTVHQGLKAVEKAFRNNFTLIKGERYAISKVHWIIRSDDFAVYSFDYDWSGIMNGNPIAGSGRGTSSLVREGGTWLLVSEHLGPRAVD